MDEVQWKRFIILAIASLAMVGMSIWGLSALNESMSEAVKAKQTNSTVKPSPDNEKW